jgi:ribosome-associated protein
MRHCNRPVETKPPSTALSIPESEVDYSVARSGGPGGQNVNKVNSKVHLCFNIWASKTLSSEQKRTIFTALSEANDRRLVDGAIILTSQEHRSQFANRQAALDKLNDLVRELLTPKVERIATEEPEAVDANRQKNKRVRSERKQLRRNQFDLD